MGGENCGRTRPVLRPSAQDQYGRRPWRGLGRFQRLEEVAFEYAFAVKVAGLAH